MDYSTLPQGARAFASSEDFGQHLRSLCNNHLLSWIRYDEWTATEAAALLAGLIPDPDNEYGYHNSYTWYELVGEWHPSYDYYLDMERGIYENFARANLGEKASPQAWVEYAQNKAMVIPEQLNKHLVLFPNWFPSYSPQSNGIKSALPQIDTAAELGAGYRGKTYAKLEAAMNAYPEKYGTAKPKIDDDVRPWLRETHDCTDREAFVFGMIIAEHFGLK